MSYLAHSNSESRDLGVYESPQVLECAHANEGAMEGYHADEKITCLLQLHDDFADFFFFDFARFLSMADLITRLLQVHDDFADFFL